MLKRTNPSPAAPLSDTQKHTRAAAFACDTPAPSECGSTGSCHLKQRKRRYPQVLTSTRVSKHFNECMRITTAVNNRSAEERGQISIKYLHHYSSTTQKHLNQHVPVEGTHFPCELCHFLSIFTFDNQPWFHCRVPETTGKARRWMFSGDSRYAILDFRAKFL